MRGTRRLVANPVHPGKPIPNAPGDLPAPPIKGRSAVSIWRKPNADPGLFDFWGTQRDDQITNERMDYLGGYRRRRDHHWFLVDGIRLRLSRYASRQLAESDDI